MQSDLLYRRRLVNQINSSRDNVTYIHAPSGYGKSVLAQQWSETTEGETIWFRGFATNQSSELLSALTEAVGSAIPELNKVFEEFDFEKTVTAHILDDLIRSIQQTNTRFNLVIDDAEIIRNNHQGFARHLVKNMPPNVRLLLLTETPPRISFIQESGAERFTFIGPNDLNFTLEEIDQYAKQLKVSQPLSDLQTILDLTQGWPIGVHVALMQLAVHGDFPGLVASIKGKNIDRFGLVAQRVLAHLEPDHLKLLTELAVLESIDSDVVQKISNSPDAIRTLTVLSQDSLVLSQTEFNPPAFKIHPLLRKALVREFLYLEDFQERVERVFNILQESGRVEELIAILLELGETQRLRQVIQNPALSNIIERGIQESIDQSSIQRMINWRDLASLLQGQESGLAAMIDFYIALHEGNSAECSALLQKLSKAPDSAFNFGNSMSRSPLITLRAILDFKSGRFTSCFELISSEVRSLAEENLPPTRHHLRALYLALLGSVMLDDDSQVKSLSNLLELNIFDELKINSDPCVAEMQALIAGHQGRLVEAQNHLLRPQPTGRISYNGYFTEIAANLVEAMVQSEAGDHQRGIDVLELILNPSISAQNFPVAIYALGRLGYQRVLTGDTEEAPSLIQTARELIQQQGLSDEVHDVLDVWEIRVRYWLVDHERVRDLISRSSRSYLVRAFEAGILINSENPKKALPIVDTFDLTIPRQLLTYHLFRAHIFADSPKTQFDEVKAAVEIGSKHGYFNHFLTQRSDVIAQYISLVAEAPTVFNENLAQAAGVRLNAMMLGKSNSGESLTRREADILRHLATSLSLAEIANTLFISQNTIKTHCKHIYRKLGAKNRDDAVNKGKKLFKI